MSDAFVEFAGERIVTSPAFWVTVIDMGTARRPFRNLQFDGAVGFGVSDAATDRTFTLGVTARL